MKNNSLSRNIYSILTVLFLIGVVYFVATAQYGRTVQEIPISQLVKDVEEKRIDKVTIQGNKITATTKDGINILTYKEASQGLADYGLSSDKVMVDIKNPDSGAIYSSLLSILIPFALLGLLLWYLTRQARGGQNQAMSFGRTTARAYDGKNKVTFADVAGLVAAKQELSEIVDFLKHPEKFKAIGAEIPRGVLLVGPAGVGKTLLAKAVAGEAGVPFFSLSASEFVEMFVGVGASRVRDLFLRAKKNAPTVIFIDELDAVGRQRGSGLGGSHDEREQTLNQILVEMDGFDTEANVIVLAATNRPDVLDPALLRPGRFDRKVVLDLPDKTEREAILKVHARNKPIASSVNFAEVAKSTPGLSGAELRNVINEAAIIAAQNGQKKIEQKDIRLAIEKVVLGPERTSHIMKEQEKTIVAYHEAGHAIIGHVLNELDPVHKVSIISRGMALGYTLSLPEDEKKLIPKKRFEQEVAQLLGGRAAEHLTFNEITTGASNDLERVTTIARNMVTIFGMSPIGPIKLGEREELIFLGREMSHHKVMSEELAARIDKEISAIIDRGWQEAIKILTKHKAELKALAEKLLAVETLDYEELQEFFATIKA